MANTFPRRFVLVSPPSVLAAIGEALRRAFGKPAPMDKFERLISKLDRN